MNSHPMSWGLHECDNTICVRVVLASDVLRGVPAHVIGSDQRANMARMARMRRGGGRRAILARGAGVAARVERARAIRAAVKDGWDQEQVAADRTELGSRRCQTGSGGILFRQMRTRAAPGPA